MPRRRPATRLPALLLLCSLAAACAGGGLPPVSDWERAGADDGGVSALFPGAPQTQRQSVDTPGGAVDVHFAVWEVQSVAFAVNHVTYPFDPAQFDVAGALEAAGESAANSVNGEVLESDQLSFEGFPGREVLVRTGDGFFVRARTIIDGSRPTLYQLQVVGTRELVDGPQAEAFFESFEIHH